MGGLAAIRRFIRSDLQDARAGRHGLAEAPYRLSICGIAGQGAEFAKEAFAARFTRGEDLARDQVLSEIAPRVGLEPEQVTSAADAPGFRERLGRGFAKAAGDAIFGVPTFIYRNQMFFGNDRLEWLVKAIER